MHLALIDWVIIAVYLVGCMTAGIWMRRYVRGVEDFAVAGRTMDLNLGIASLAATELGLVTVMYTAQLGFTNGFAGATIGVLIATAMYLVGRTGFVIGPLRRAGVMTIPELFQKRFGTKVRWLAGLFIVLGGVLNMGIFLRLGGEFLVAATGMPAHWLEWVMTILLSMILLYTVLGGMLSVLVTDYLQFIVKGIGIVVTSILVISSVGWGDLVRGLWQCWDGSGSASGQLLHAHPFNPFHASGFGWGYILWQFVLAFAATTTWQTQISRVLSARDEETAKRMYRRTAFYFVGRFALPGLWGAAALVYFTQHGGLPETLQGLSANEASLRATPAYLGLLLPTGFIGLLLAAALAAEMSTDSGYLLTWATVIYNDLISPCVKRPLSAAARLLITRALVLGIGVFLLFYGLWYELPGNAWDYLAVTGNIYLASVFTLLVAGLYWRRATTQGAYAALLLGAIGPLTFLIVNMLVLKARLLSAHAPAVPSLAQEWLLQFSQFFPNAEPIRPELAGASSFALAFLGMLVGSLLSRRPAGGSPNPPEAVA
ncbi:MAG TPA: sodium:solute symporter family protein [Candidatus Paceibacterota bacterium]|nr:sodium:solute symporter family protein [Verrucomicrobiota bacterium]HSA09936.1 sodium:solute symporter family protein [Candidatus Paceibacterota bacterium]